MSGMRNMRPILFLLLAAPACFAQAGKAELFGTVFDPSGAVVPMARVEAVSEDTRAKYMAISDSRGEYHLLGLPPGQYALTVLAQGFAPFRQTAFGLPLGGQALHDIMLALAGSDTVDVTAQAPLLQTVNGSVSYAVDQIKVSTLPLDGRNFIPLIALSPGAALPGGGSLLLRINGSRPHTNQYIST